MSIWWEKVLVQGSFSFAVHRPEAVWMVVVWAKKEGKDLFHWVSSL